MDKNTQIIAARQGDRSALTRVLLEYRGMIETVVCRFIDETEARKDAVQNIFVKVIRSIGGFEARCAFSTWIYRICVNECVDALRKRSQTAHFGAGFGSGQVFRDPNAHDGAEELDESEIRSAIKNQIDRLPLDQRAAFELFYYGGYSGCDAAKVMKIREANFFMKLKAARDSVKKALRAGGWHQ